MFSQKCGVVAHSASASEKEIPLKYLKEKGKIAT